MSYLTIAIIFITPLSGDSQVDTTLANKYVIKADSLSKAIQYDSAIFYYKKASDIYLTVAKVIDMSIQKNETMSRFTDSSRSGERIWAKYITCQNQIGWHLALYKAEYKTALALLKNTLETGKNMLNNHHPEIARTYNNIGAVFYLSGNYEKALDNFKRSLSIFLNSFVRDHPSVGSALNNIGNVYYWIIFKKHWLYC